jgi:hypothetical protein
MVRVDFRLFAARFAAIRRAAIAMADAPTTAATQMFGILYCVPLAVLVDMANWAKLY